MTLVDAIGNTPLVPLPDGIVSLPARVSVWCKIEGSNPGGSVKDRPARHLVRDAEQSGRLRPGGTILDASSGNTGIAYALIAASRGYRLVLCLPKNASAERQKLLSAYGATVVLTSPLEGTDGAQREAARLAEENPDWVYLNQYDNDANWRAHFETTGPEIWRQTAGTLTHFVATVGTSGTLMGTSRYLRSIDAGVRIIEVQPDSPLHGLEGVKHLPTARVPKIYDPSLIDEHRAADSESAFAMVRVLARHGILVGPSSGAAALAAVRVAKELEHGVVVATLCDSGTRYLSDPHLWASPSEEDRWLLAG
jgi:S-sulfo-L-cysteine synthase (O-acetyl-L-serine-dependent)